MTRRVRRPILRAAVCAICLVGAVAARAQAQLEGAGIPYGKEIGALVQAPKGWIFDNQSGVSQGLHCVMYPQGTSWRTAGEVIYVTISELKPDQTLEEFVGADAADFQQKSAELEVRTLPSIVLVTGQEALVRRFMGDRFGNHECVAYAQLGRSVASFVLSCRTQAGYEKSIGPFLDMVAQVSLVKMQMGVQPAPAVEVAVEPAGPASYGYSHWIRFKPGTFVSFKYTLRSPRASEEMIKTITLKEATAGFIRLDYQESPPVPGAARIEHPPAYVEMTKTEDLLYQRRQEDYGEAEEEFETTSPVESLLNYGISGYLEDPRCRPLGNGEEEVDWRGRKLRTSWTKLRLGSGDVPTTTVTIWRCDKVPGGLFRFLREIGGDTASREEVVVGDLHVIPASAAEIETLRASRQPVTIEVPAMNYIRARCRAIGMFRDLMVISPDLNRNLDHVKSVFDADRQRISSELDPQEAAKLAPVLDGIEAVLGHRQKAAEVLTKALEKAARGPIDEAAARGIEAELAGLKSQFSVENEQARAAFEALGGVSVKFTKKPG